MLAMSPSSSFMEAGLHFQLPPTMGLRDMVVKIDCNEEELLAV
jgi:hypothetical protein